MGVIFTTVGFMGIEENRTNPVLGESVGDRIHGRRRHSAVRSCEAAEFDDGIGVLRPDITQAGTVFFQIPEWKIRSSNPEGWAAGEVHPWFKF